jgi:hypothetical protein
MQNESNAEPVAVQDPAPGAVEAVETADAGDMPAIVEALGTLPAGAIITEPGLAGIFKRCTASVKAAIDRGELPRPVRMFGKPVWTAGAVLKHLEGRLDAEERKFARLR